MSNISYNLELRLAQRIRTERENKAWSLADLAALSGVSKAMISKIERGEVSPTAALLGKLSGAFGLTLASMLSDPSEPPSKVRRKQDQQWWTDPESGQYRTTLSPPAAHQLQLVQSELPPNARINYPALSYIFIVQQIWVMSGTLTFQEGSTVHVLEEGDCIELSEAAECSFRNMSKSKKCTYLVAITRRI
jgi:transcriptional regulator with XRE-family HTH domain